MIDSKVTRRVAATAAAMTVLAAYSAMAGADESKTMTYPVHFPSGSAKLHKADMETIQGVASTMMREPSLMATILGKADVVGSHQYNEHLSWRRASAVFEALVFTYKVPASRVELRWAGKNMPTIPHEEGKPELLNRVVEIILNPS